jgi:hypothetical protein
MKVMKQKILIFFNLINYYQKTPTPTSDESEKYIFLPKKIEIFFGFFFMLRPIKVYQARTGMGIKFTIRTVVNN